MDRYKQLLAESIPGWIDVAECRKLHELGMIATGPILEIGHLLGRSTACICEGIKDSGTRKVFRSYDMDFRTDEDLQRFYAAIHRREVVVPDLNRELHRAGRLSTEVAREN